MLWSIAAEGGRMNTITPIRSVEPALRPQQQIGDPAKCAWCGDRAKSAFAITHPGGWVFRRGVCGREACGEEAAEVRSRIGPHQRLVDLA
jgi:hypothetical protein